MRLSLDLDAANAAEVLMLYDVLKHELPNLRVYRTRNGYHIESDPSGLPFAFSLLLRYILGDDLRRVRHDCARWPHRPVDFLFKIRRGVERKRVA